MVVSKQKKWLKILLFVTIAVIIMCIVTGIAMADNTSAAAESSLMQSLASALYSLYGNGFGSKIGESIGYVVKAIANFTNTSNLLASSLSIFAGISASLITVYFYLDLMDQSARDLMSMEKFVTMFIKMMICISVVMMSQHIINAVLDLTDYAFDAMYNITNSSVSYTAQDDRIASFRIGDDEVTINNEEALTNALVEGLGWDNAKFKFMVNLRLMVRHPFWTMEALIISLVTAVLRLIVYFMAISAGIVLLIRLFLLPIGIVNLYRGADSSGMQYLKGVIADACVFAGQILVVMVAASLGTSLLTQNMSFFGVSFGAGGGKIIIDLANNDSISQALNFKTVVVALIPQIAAIGGMGSVSRIMHEVFGVRF